MKIDDKLKKNNLYNIKTNKSLGINKLLINQI